MSMIEVHAEVFSISPKFVGRVMAKVTEAVVEEVTRLIHCVDAFGANGALQVICVCVCSERERERERELCG